MLLLLLMLLHLVLLLLLLGSHHGNGEGCAHDGLEAGLPDVKI